MKQARLRQGMLVPLNAKGLFEVVVVVQIVPGLHYFLQIRVHLFYFSLKEQLVCLQLGIHGVKPIKTVKLFGHTKDLQQVDYAKREAIV